MIRRSRQIQFFSGQTTNAFAVHRQQSCPGSGDHGKTFGLQLDQGRGRNGFDFRDDIMRLLGLDHCAQGGTVEHVDYMTTMRDLHGWRVGITVNSDHFDAQALQFDHHLLAKLAATAEQYARRGRRQWRSDLSHLRSSWSRSSSQPAIGGRLMGRRKARNLPRSRSLGPRPEKVRRQNQGVVFTPTVHSMPLSRARS